MGDPPSSGNDPTGGGIPPTPPPSFPTTPPTFGTGPTGGPTGAGGPLGSGPVLTNDAVISESGPRTTRWLLVAVTIVILAVGAAAAVFLWPDGDDADDEQATSTEEQPSDEPGLSVGTGGPTEEEPGSTSGGPEPEEPAEPQEPSEPSEPAEPTVADLIQVDPTPAIRDFEEAIGAPYQARSIVLYDEYALVEYQDPEAPTHIDRRTWFPDRMDGPSPVALSQGFTPDVEASLYDPTTIAFKRVPDMADAALAEFDLENPVVTHVIVDKVFGDGDVVLRVYVSDPERGGGGYVEFSPKGRLLEVIG